jgi:hypothetical protein
VAAQWNIEYFRLTYLPKFLTAGALLMHINNGKLPQPFLLPAVLEAAIGVATMLLVFNIRKSSSGNGSNLPFKLHFDRVCVAQQLHAVLSGAFQMAMLLVPELALPLVLSKAIDPEAAAAAIKWGRFMGAAEIMMTYTYMLSGCFGALEPFVRLSVVTRILAFALLTAGWAMGLCVHEQVLGVLGDVALAFITILTLQWIPMGGRPVASAVACVL